MFVSARPWRRSQGTWTAPCCLRVYASPADACICAVMICRLAAYRAYADLWKSDHGDHIATGVFLRIFNRRGEGSAARIGQAPRGAFRSLSSSILTYHPLHLRPAPFRFLPSLFPSTFLPPRSRSHSRSRSRHRTLHAPRPHLRLIVVSIPVFSSFTRHSSPFRSPIPLILPRL
ncbi:hypothetical protein C8R47DRAFT_813003 [Mycena vitilis]|nr:hypothetical protein C8R47DRAFT_813003 [Mycena vitilis]